MSSEGFDRLWEAHLLQDVGLPRLGGLSPVVWFGVINAGALVLGYLAAEVIGRRLDVGSVAVASRALFVLDALTIAGVLAFALAGSFGLALVAFWLAGIARRLGEPRSEEHTSELQSRQYLVCRLLLAKKNTS